MGRGGGYKMGGGGAREVSPLQKGGGVGKVLAMLKGGGGGAAQILGQFLSGIERGAHKVSTL